MGAAMPRRVALRRECALSRRVVNTAPATASVQAAPTLSAARD